MLGDPAYLLPWADRGKPGVDHQVAIDADASVAAMPVAGGMALLLQRFGGDGTYPVFGRFDGEELLSVRVEFIGPEG